MSITRQDSVTFYWGSWPGILVATKRWRSMVYLVYYTNTMTLSQLFSGLESNAFKPTETVTNMRVLETPT